MLGNRQTKEKSIYECKCFIKTLPKIVPNIDLLKYVTDAIYLGSTMYIITPRIGKFIGRSKTLKHKLESYYGFKLDFIKDDFSFNCFKLTTLREDD